MQEVKIFNNAEFGQVRTVTIDGEVWFVGKDVTEALGYKNSRDALGKHVYAEDKGVGQLDTLGGKQNMTIINESGLYGLIFGSELESAKRFKRWVTSEVLPSIRKTGGYQKPMSTLELLELQTSVIREHDDRITSLENNMTIDHNQENRLKKLVNAVVIDALGGSKNTEAYKSKSVRGKVYSECNRDIQDYFNVASRNDVPKKRFEEAVEYIKAWKPCVNTVLLVKNHNAQCSFC